MRALEEENASLRRLLGAALEDSARIDCLEAHAQPVTVNGQPSSARGYSVVTELTLRGALDVLRKQKV